MAFADTLRALNAMKAEGVVDEYAIAGAMAVAFWAEPVPTFDLDVLVELPSTEGPLPSLDGIYRWAEKRGYATEDGHVVVEGLPTQFVLPSDPQAREAISNAATVDFEGVAVRVVRPEYLKRPFPSEALLEELHEGKGALHKRHSALALPEKVGLVMELQRVVLPLIAQRRPLRSWERPWEITPRTPWERLRAWYEREATLLDLAAVGAVVLAAIVGAGVVAMRATSRSRSEGVRPMGTVLSAEQLTVLLELPEQQVVPAGLEIIDRPDATFAPGDPMHLRLSLRAPSRIALVEEPPGGPVVQAWPGLSQAPALIPRPSSGGPALQAVALDAPAEPGAHRLRLVVAPADLDLGALPPAALREAAARLTLVDLRYQVRP